MKKWLFRIFWIPVFLVAVVFLLANRQLVAISLDPFNADNPAVTTPAFFLWVWLSLMLMIGFAAGAVGMWISGRDKRIEARTAKKALKAMTKENTTLKTKLSEVQAKLDGRGSGASVPATRDEAPLLQSEPTS